MTTGLWNKGSQKFLPALHANPSRYWHFDVDEDIILGWSILMVGFLAALAMRLGHHLNEGRQSSNENRVGSKLSRVLPAVRP